jgi:Holliday junction resolvasome RuvABC DNA-binding subunit
MAICFARNDKSKLNLCRVTMMGKKGAKRVMLQTTKRFTAIKTLTVAISTGKIV